ncbi:CLUMA_CG019608, isoform A [Clunio marinus]|uniref:CLUMA_CG019608, isoform A n=1 Tax=Clunio marinus TaxID=568069 RepID=A0A1J1J2C7_9DIPT|nr:CLUMA_CG019608, isoform A [Clunio marinus]
MVDKWIGKTAIVTGASAGIGASIFQELAKTGINVIGLARRSEKVKEIIEKMGATKGKAYAYKCDVSDPKSVELAFKWIEGTFNVVHILINNAGIGRAGNILDATEDAFRKLNEVLDTNVRGLIQCTREAYRLMKKSNDYGLIININSVAGHYIPYIPKMSIYPASKFAVRALTESLRQELAMSDNKKVRVTNLSPGGVRSDIRVTSGYKDTPDQPSDLLLEAEDISHSVIFLLSTPYSVNITELTIRPTVSMVDKWIGKIAVVTGCASGIGAAIYKEFIENNIITVGLDINCINDDSEFGEKSKNAFFMQCNIAKPESVKEIFKKIEDQFNVVNIIVNCAGIGRKAEILDDDEKSFQVMNDVVDVNLRGLMQCTREAFKLMKKSNDYGLIVNINSVAGHKTPLLDISLNIYGATKYALTAFNEAVRHELNLAKNKKVRISSISPGIVDSNFIKASGYTASTSTEHVFDEIPMLKPKEIAKGVIKIRYCCQSRMEKWRGKVAIVTGASAGIGAAIVRDLANAGINVIALARRAERLESLKNELQAAPGKVTPMTCDVSDKASIESTFEAIENTFETVNILINNAGVIRDVEILDSSDDLEAIGKMEQVITTNFTGLVHCTRKAFRLIEKSNDYGMIINIGSVAGHGIPNIDFKFNVYPGTKFAVRATTEVLRMELNKKNNKKIRISEISPGGVWTEIQTAGGFEGSVEEWMAAGEFPILQDVDVSQAVTFLLMTPYTVNMTEIIIKPTDMEKWRGKIAVVTGASAGIGADVVRQFAKKGIHVIGLARRPEKIEEIAKEVGVTSGKIHAYRCDVSNKDSIDAAFKWIEEKFKVVNILINNAGLGHQTSILANEDNDEKLKQVIDTNFTGLVRVTRSAFKLMNKSDNYGMIININSIVGHITPFPSDGNSRSNVYAGTKFAVTAVTEVLRQELVCMKNTKIRISSLSPGVVETDFFHSGEFVPKSARIGDLMPALKASDITDSILFLLSTPYNVNVTEITVRPTGEIMEKWSGKFAVVTGASAGIGAEITKDLVKIGVNVIGLARRPERIENIAKELGETPGKIYSRMCDVSDLELIKSAFKWIEEKFGVVHILVNNAGIVRNIKILTDEDVSAEINSIINTNFTGLVHVTHEAYRLIKKSKDYGMIININSNAGYKIPFPPNPEISHNVYHGTKFAVTATTEVLRQELICQENDKVRVTSLSPGVTITEIFKTYDVPAFKNMPAINAEDVSNAVLYLLSTPYHVNITELTIKHVSQKF